MKVRGTIQHFFYPKNVNETTKEPTEWAIFIIKMNQTLNGKKKLTIKGAVPPVKIYDYLEFDGELDGDGEMLLNACYRIDDDEEGAKSMMAFCFGKKTATKIIEVGYDGEALPAWEDFKTRLDSFLHISLQIKGIGEKTMEKGIHKYENHIAVDTIASKYSKYGLKLERALSVYQAWGKSSVERIEKNPYSLLNISVPFTIADRIALQCYSLSVTDPRRVYGGVVYTMKHVMSQKGHCFMWLKEVRGRHKGDNLLEYVSRLLSVDQSLVLEEILNLVHEGRLKLDKKGFYDVIYLPRMYEAEKGIARIVRDSIATNSVSNDMIHDFIRQYEQDKGFRMAFKQKEAVSVAVRNKLSIISGPPGSGKTTIIDCICMILRKLYPQVHIQLAAPTGKAAKRMTESTGMPASTVHRLLEYSPMTRDFTRNEANPLDADCIVVDEFSMMSTMLTYQFLRAVPQRCMVIFVGDKDQLPSVDAGKVLEDLLEIHYIPKVILNKIYRQGNDSTILPRALDISQEKMPNLSEAKDFKFWNVSDREKVESKVLELYYSECEHYGIDNVLLLSPMNKYELGVDNLNLIIQEHLNPPRDDRPAIKVGRYEKRDRFFRKYDRVIQTKNEDEFGVYNGMVGTIVDVIVGDKELETHDTLYVDFGDVQCEYTRERFDNLKLAYALTIHKCQGSEAQSVIMICHHSQKFMMRKKLIYTGMTRAKKKLQIVGEPSMIERSLTVLEDPRNSKLKDYLAH